MAEPAVEGPRRVDAGKRRDIERVWESWLDYQRFPDRCVLSESRVDLIASRLHSHSAEELCLVVQYAFEANTPEMRFLRGDNRESRTYLDLENLLRASKIDSRVERAIEWAAREDQDVADIGVRLSPVAVFKRGPWRG